MTKKTNDDCSTGACPVDKPQDAKLVKSGDLPLVGNPYPPKDVIENDNPSLLEIRISSLRTAMQPFMSPLCKAYGRASDFLATGAAHTQSAIQGMSEGSNTVTHAAVATGASLFGLLLARRRGLFVKLITGSTFGGGALAACYPKEAMESAELAWYITKNKLPALVSEQYAKFADHSANGKTTTQESDKTSEVK